MVAKPSPETPLTALTLAYLAEKAGYPKGVFNVLPTTLDNTPALSEALCRHPTVKKVSFTGSVCFPEKISQTNFALTRRSKTKDSRGKDFVGTLCG